MRILFVHQNFPGQFLHLAPALAARGHDVLALTDQGNTRKAGVRVLRYKSPQPLKDPQSARLGRTYARMAERGLSVARAARVLRDRHGWSPDLVVGHPGWGETLFLRGIWPEARQLLHAEFWYAPHGLDVGFDPEFRPQEAEFEVTTLARQAHMAHALAAADLAIAPTAWQAGTFPPILRDRIRVIHEGIDTARAAPDRKARFTLPGGGAIFEPGDEVLSFVNRNLEPYRGFHIFMRALPAVLAARPAAHVVVVGGDGASYGRRPPDEGGWRARMLAELGDRIDLARVHFTGVLPYSDYLRLLQVTRVHAYLTYPFVLSWSLLEAMAAGAHVVASRTGPVEEVLVDGETGTLVDFFDVEGWERALVAALADPDANQGLRSAARAHVVETYDLRNVALPALVDLVEGLGP